MGPRNPARAWTCERHRSVARTNSAPCRVRIHRRPDIAHRRRVRQRNLEPRPGPPSAHRRSPGRMERPAIYPFADPHSRGEAEGRDESAHSSDFTSARPCHCGDCQPAMRPSSSLPMTKTGHEHLVLFSAPDMEEYTAEVLGLLPLPTAAKLEVWRGDLRSFIVMTSRSKRMFTMDSGPAHISAALGRDTVVFFGPNLPEYTSPRGPTVPNRGGHVRAMSPVRPAPLHQSGSSRRACGASLNCKNQGNERSSHAGHRLNRRETRRVALEPRVRAAG